MKANRPRWATTRLRDMIGRTCITTREMKNGWMIIPSGMPVVIESGTNAWHKIAIAGPKCECCGVQARISGVDIHDLAPATSTTCQRPEGGR